MQHNYTNTNMPKRKFILTRIYTLSVRAHSILNIDQPWKIHSWLEFCPTFQVKMQSLYDLLVHKLCVHILLNKNWYVSPTRGQPKLPGGKLLVPPSTSFFFFFLQNKDRCNQGEQSK